MTLAFVFGFMATTNPTRDPVQSPGLLAFRPTPVGEGQTERARKIEELVVRCQSGEPRAFDELVRLIEPPLLRLAAAVLGDPVAAEDAFVEAMARVLPRIADVKSGAFSTYARRAVRNAAVDLRRSRNYRDSRDALAMTGKLQRGGDRTPVPERLVDGSPSPEVSAIQSERTRRLRVALEGLEEPRQTIVRLRYQQGLTNAEICDKLALSMSTVKRHLVAARLLLASRMGIEGVHDEP